MNLSIGAGKFSAPGWTNLDYNFPARTRKRGRIDIECNLMDGKLPLANKSVEKIYSEHCIEHLPLNVAKKILAECYRILVPNGVIRISVPGAELIIEDCFKKKSYMKGRKQSKVKGLWQFAVDLIYTPSCKDGLSDDAIVFLFKHGAEYTINNLTRALPQDKEQQFRRPGCHNSAWTFNRMRVVLEKIGFKSVVRYSRPWGPEFDKTVPPVSLRIEAKK